MSVLLLRGSPESSEKDKYEPTFSSAGYTALSIPVLETVFANLDSLQSILSQGPQRQGIGGVILTSKRSCDALRALLQTQVQQHHLELWSGVPFYVVGHATASALLSLSELGLRVTDIRGESSGTGEKLAKFIVDDARLPGKLLYLTGDKNRDTVPVILGNASIELLELRVYATQGSGTFETDLESALDGVAKEKEWWIVYFAPSAAEFVTPILRKHFHLPSISNGTREEEGFKAKVASIGPVTSAFLADKFGLRVDATAAQPTADSLLSAIKEVDGR